MYFVFLDTDNKKRYFRTFVFSYLADKTKSALFAKILILYYNSIITQLNKQ